MISNYVSELIRLLIKGKLFSKEELKNLLEMSDEQCEATLAGSNSHVELNHIENLTAAFGLQIFWADFISNIFSSGNLHTDGHLNTAAESDEFRLKMEKMYAFFGGRKNTIMARLARLNSIQSYIASSDLMMEALKDAGVLEAMNDTEEENE